MISIPVAASVTLALDVPAGATEEPESALPRIDVSAVPGARVVLRRGFAGEGLSLRAACVLAPSDRWAPGLEELVLGRATSIATAGAGDVRWEPGPVERRSDRFEQRLVGRADGRELAGVHHTLGFVGEDHDVLLCSTVCLGGGAACSKVVTTATLEGTLTGAPPPSLLVRAALLTAERPRDAAVSVGLALAALIALLLLRRPRVPGRRFFP